jgi:branched-chain amino acid transport system permease protein
MQTLLQQIVNGLVLGSLYALVALGYTMVYGLLQLFNFAHGELFMTGAYFALFALTAVGTTTVGPVVVVVGLLLLAFVAAGFGSAVLGTATERFAYRPIANAPRIAALISVLGVSIVLQNAVMLIAGRRNKTFPQLISDGKVVIAGVQITYTQIFIIAFSVLLMLSLLFFVKRTVFGMSIRAVAENRDAARLMGINVMRVIQLVFVIGPALGGMAGVMFGMYYGTIFFTMGFVIGIKAFTAAVVGGIGSIEGAVLGGLLLGLLESIGAGYLPALSFGLLGSEYRDIFTFVVLISVLVLKPEGILGTRKYGKKRL